MLAELRVLLVNGSSDHQWHKLVAQIVGARGCLQIGSEATIDAWLAQSKYAVVIIDASVVAHVPQLIRYIHAQQPAARVVVVAAAPTWQNARDAFQAGAFDYTVKSLNRDELATFLGAAIDLQALA